MYSKKVCLVSVGSRRTEEPDPLDPGNTQRMHNMFKYNQIDETFYGETKFHPNNSLKWCYEYFDICIHALGAYFASRGEFALHSSQEEVSLKVSALVLPANAAGKDEAGSLAMMDLYDSELHKICEKRSLQFPHLSTASEEVVSVGSNDFFVMQKAASEAANTPPLKSVLSLMKLSGWDPDVFYKFRNLYALDKEKDIAFEIGRLCYNLHEYDSAIAYHALSVWVFALNNSYQKAPIWLQRVHQETGAVLVGGVCTVPTQPAMQHLTDIVVHEQALQPPGSMLA
uniref:Uncharacterized protein n=1 Tax=Peronospora matthiolae TaxID=2874970 RepID=A0AAV1TM10_9STRA